jgi:hypothetical protein
VIGVDPELADPENGDYRPAPGSLAEAYGCQTFPTKERMTGSRPALPKAPPVSLRRDVIDVSGSISVDTVWSASTVRVVGDVTVEHGVTLTIEPDVRVEFQDYYRLAIAGTILAVGTPDHRILFTTDEPQNFVVDESHTGCWNGLRFDETLATNAPSRLAYCIIEYSKATGGSGGLHPYGGGAISVTDFSKLTIENCIIRNNAADYGGALFLYRNANPRVIGNLIVDNHALENSAAVYCAYAYPTIANNTIVRNWIHNEEDPYIESCALLAFVAKPVFTNNIIRNNDPDFVYMHTQLWANKDYYTHNNNIEDYATTGGNIDDDPLFVDPDGPDGVPGTSDDDFRLALTSPSIDAGLNEAVPPDMTTDLDGHLRVVDGTFDGTPTVDMGGYEHQIEQGIPATSDWGATVMLLLLITAGSLVFARRCVPREL